MQIRTQYVLKNNKVLNRCPKIMQPSLRKRCEYESRNYLAVGLIQRDRLEIKTKKKRKRKKTREVLNTWDCSIWFQRGQVVSLALGQQRAFQTCSTLWSPHRRLLACRRFRDHARYPVKAAAPSLFQNPINGWNWMRLQRSLCCFADLGNSQCYRRLQAELR